MKAYSLRSKTIHLGHGPNGEKLVMRGYALKEVLELKTRFVEEETEEEELDPSF
jgi:hypothetical protein